MSADDDGPAPDDLAERQRTPADELTKVRPAPGGRSEPEELSNDDATETDGQ